MPSPRKDKEFQEFQELLINPECLKWPQKQYATVVGVNEQTICNWRQTRVDWEYINKQRRANYAQHTADIDKVLIEKAKKGELKSIELYYQRWDDWTPTTAVQNTHDIDEAEIDAELSRLLSSKKDTLEALKPSPEPSPSKQDRDLAKEMVPKAVDAHKEGVPSQDTPPACPEEGHREDSGQEPGPIIPGESGGALNE